MTLHGQIYVIRKTGEDGSCFPLLSRTCRVGKGHICDIRIQRDRVSEEHCLIEVGNDFQARIRNFTENCQTSVNGVPLTTEFVGLKHMDVIVIADRSFRWEYLKGSKYYSDKSFSNQQSMEATGSHKNEQFSKENPYTITQESMDPEKNVECYSSANNVPDMISFDSPVMVSDSKKHGRMSLRKSGICDVIKMPSEFKEKTKTPKRKTSVLPKETEEKVLSVIPGKAQQSFLTLQKTEICLLSIEESESKENNKASVNRCDGTEVSDLVGSEVESNVLGTNNGKRRSLRGKTNAFGMNSWVENSTNSVVVVTNTEYEGLDKKKARESKTPLLKKCISSDKMNNSINKSVNLSLDKTSGSMLINTPNAMRMMPHAKNSEQSPLLDKTREPPNKDTDRTPCQEVSSTSMTHSGSKVLSIEKQNKSERNSVENVPSENSEKAVKIVVIPPTPEQGLNHEGEKSCVSSSSKNYFVFSKLRKSSIKQNTLDGSVRKSKMEKHQISEQMKICEESKQIRGIDVLERNANLSGFLSADEKERKLQMSGNAELCVENELVQDDVSLEINDLFQRASDSSKKTPSQNRMQMVIEKANVNESTSARFTSELDLSSEKIGMVTSANGGDWAVSSANKSSRKESLRSRKSFNISNVKDQSSVFQEGVLDCQADMTKTPLPSDDEYASWLSEISRRNSTASINKTNSATPSHQKLQRRTVHGSCTPSYIENVREVMKTPLTISVNNTPLVESANKSRGSTGGEKGKTFSPRLRRSIRKGTKIIGTPCFAASIFNRLRTPTAVDSKSLPVADMESNSNAYVTLRKNTRNICTTPETNSEDVDFLSDISTNGSCVSNGEMDSLMQTSSLLLDESNVSKGQINQNTTSHVKSSWTSTPAANNSTRKRNVSFRTSVDSEAMGELLKTPVDSDVACSVEFATPTANSFIKQSMATVNGNKKESVRKNSMKSALNKEGTRTPSKFELSSKCGGSVFDSSYNSALDDTCTLVSTPSLSVKDRSQLSMRSLRSCKSLIENTPIANQKVSKYMRGINYKTPSTSSIVCNDNVTEEEYSLTRGSTIGDSKISSHGFLDNKLNLIPDVIFERMEIEPVEFNIKVSKDGKDGKSETDPSTSTSGDTACNSSNIDICREWSVLSEGKSSRKESLRSRKSFNISNVKDQSSVFQEGVLDCQADMTKTPLPSDDEYASWLSEISRRNSTASINKTNSATPSHQKLQRRTVHGSCTPSYIENVREVMKTPLTISVNNTPLVESANKSRGSTGGEKGKTFSPRLRRSIRKGTKIIGTPCFAASIFNRLRTPTAVDSKSLPVADMESNSNAYVTLRKNTRNICTTPETNSEDVDFLSDISTNGSCVSNGEMDSLMQTSSLLLDESNVSKGQINQNTTSHVKSSWTSTPAANNSTRKRNVSFRTSVDSEAMGELLKTPVDSDVACSVEFVTPTANSFIKQSMATKTEKNESVKKNKKTTAKEGKSPSIEVANLNSKQVVNIDETTINNGPCEETINLVDFSGVSEQYGSRIYKASTTKLSEFSVISDITLDVSETLGGSEYSLSSPEQKLILLDSSDEMIDSMVDNVEVGNKHDAEKKDAINDISIGSGNKKSRLRKPSMNVSFKATPQTSKSTRSSVNYSETTDYSENIRDMLKTPASILQSGGDETNADECVEGEEFTSSIMGQSVITAQCMTPAKNEEFTTPSTDCSRRSRRDKRNSVQNEKQRRQEGDSPNENIKMNRSTSFISTTEDCTSIVEEVNENDSQEEEELMSPISSGKRKSKGRKSSINDSFKVTPQTSKSTRSSVNSSETPDYTENIRDMLKTPASIPRSGGDETNADESVEGDEFTSSIMGQSVITAQCMTPAQNEEFTTPSTDCSRRSRRDKRNSVQNEKQRRQEVDSPNENIKMNRSTSFISTTEECTSIVEEVNENDSQEEEELMSPIASGKRKSKGRKSSINDSFKVTPQTSKSTRSSVNSSETPDYSDNIRDMLKTPASIPQSGGDETNADESVKGEEFTSSIMGQSVITAQCMTPAQNEEFTTPSTNCSRRSRKDKRNSVQNEKQRQQEVDSPNKNIKMNRSTSFISTTGECTSIVEEVNENDSQEEEELMSPIASGKRKSKGIKSSINDSFKVTPQTSKSTRSSVNYSETTDYSENIRDMLKTPASILQSGGDETNADECVEGEEFTSSIMGQSVITAQCVTPARDEEFSTPSTNCSRRSRRDKRNSVQNEKQRQQEVDSPNKNIKMNRSTSFISTTGECTSIVEEVNENDSQEEEELMSPIASGKRKSKGRKSSVNDSFKVTPQTSKSTRSSVNYSETPDYSENIRDMLKTPASILQSGGDETNADECVEGEEFTSSIMGQSVINAQCMTPAQNEEFTTPSTNCSRRSGRDKWNSVQNEKQRQQEVDSPNENIKRNASTSFISTTEECTSIVEEDNENDSQEEELMSPIASVKRKSKGIKSSINDSFMVTPQTSKSTRSSVNYSETTDYSENIRDMLKTPASILQSGGDETNADECVEGEEFTSSIMGQSVITAQCVTPARDEEFSTPSTNCSRRSRRDKRNSVQNEKQRQQEVDSPNKNIKMNRSTSFISTTGECTSSVEEVNENDSQEEEELMSPIASGKRKSKGRKSSVNDSFKVTPQTSKSTRSSVNYSETPDYSENIRDMLKTPASILQSGGDETNADECVEGEEFTSSIMGQSVITAQCVTPVRDEEFSTPSTNCSRRSRRDKRNSVQNEKQRQQEVDSPNENIKRNTSTSFICSTEECTSIVQEDNENDSQEEELMSPIASVKRKSKGRKSSINDSFMVTPQISKSTRSSVNYSETPDYSENIRDMLKTPASIPQSGGDETNADESVEGEEFTSSIMGQSVITAQCMTPAQNEEFTTPSTDCSRRSRGDKRNSVQNEKQRPKEVDSPNKNIKMNRSTSFISTTEECTSNVEEVNANDSQEEELMSNEIPIASGKRKSKGRNSSINDSFKATPQTSKSTRSSVNYSETPDYSENIRDMLKTPATIPHSAIDETKSDENDEGDEIISGILGVSIIPARCVISAGDEELSTPSSNSSRRSIRNSVKKVSQGLQEDECHNEIMRDNGSSFLGTTTAGSTSDLEEDNINDFEERDKITEFPIGSSKRKSKGRKSSLNVSFKITPQRAKSIRSSVNYSATPDYSENIRGMFKTPAKITRSGVDERNVEGDEITSSIRRQSIIPAHCVTPACGDEEVTMPSSNSSRRSRGDKRDSVQNVSQRPEEVYSQNANNKITGSTSFISTTEDCTSNMEEVNAKDSQEELMSNEIPIASGKRKSKGRKSSINDSFKVTPQTSKSTRSSLNYSETPDYSENIRDMLKTPATIPRSGIDETKSDENDEGDEITSSIMGQSIIPAQCVTSVCGDEEFTTPSANFSRRSRGDKRNSVQKVLQEPQEVDSHNETKQIIGSPSFINTTVTTPLSITSRRSSGVKKSSVQNVDQGPYDDEEDNFSMEQIVVGPNDVNLSHDILNTTLNDIIVSTSGPSGSEPISEMVIHELDFPIQSGDNIEEVRKSCVNDEYVKYVKRWLAQRSPTSRYSNCHGMKELFSNGSPPSSYDDVTGIKEIFASPVIPPIHVESLAKKRKSVPNEKQFSVESTSSASCQKEKIFTTVKKPVVIVSKLSHEDIMSYIQSEHSVPVKSLRSGRGKHHTEKEEMDAKELMKNIGTHIVGERKTICEEEYASLKNQPSKGSNQRITRRTKLVEENPMNSELSLLETSNSGKENLVKRQQTSRRAGSKHAAVEKDLVVNDECNSLPGTTFDSVILKSNLRNIAGLRRSKKNVHFEAPAEEMEEQKLEHTNEDGTLLTKKTLNRKPVQENSSDKALRSEDLPSNSGKNSEMRYVGDDANNIVSANRGHLRKGVKTRVSEKADADGESNAQDDLVNGTKRLRASRGTDKGKQSTVEERTTRSKRGDVKPMVDDANKIGDKLRGGSKKKSELLKDVEAKKEVESVMALGRQTRRTRGTEKSDGLIIMRENENLKAHNINVESQEMIEKEITADTLPENHLLKKAAKVMEVQEGNSNKDVATQRPTRRGKKATIPDDNIAMNENKNVGQKNSKPESVSVKEKENSNDTKPEKKVMKKNAVAPEKKEGKTNEDATDTIAERGTRRGKVVLKLDDNTNPESARGLEGNNKGKKSKRNKRSDQEVEEREENTAMKQPRSTKNSVDEAIDEENVKRRNLNGDTKVAIVNKVEEGLEKANKSHTQRRGNLRNFGSVDESHASSSKDVQCVKLPSKKQKNILAKEEDDATVERQSTKRRNVSRNNESAGKESNVSTPENVQSVKLPPKKQKTSLVEEENDAKIDRQSRKKRNASRSNESAGKESNSSIPEDMQSVKLPSKKRKTSLVEKENDTAIERPSQKKSNKSADKDSNSSTPEDVQSVKPPSKKRKTSLVEKENDTAIERPSQKKSNKSAGKESNSSIPEDLQSVKPPSKKRKTSLVEKENDTAIERPSQKKTKVSRNDDIAISSVKDTRTVRKPSKVTSVGKKQEVEEKIPAGRQLRNQKNISSDSSKVNEAHRPCKKHTAPCNIKDETSQVSEEKSSASEKGKEKDTTFPEKSIKKIKLKDDSKENVLEKKASGRVLRKR